MPIQDVENEIYFDLPIQGLGLYLKYRISFVQLRSWPICDCGQLQSEIIILSQRFWYVKVNEVVETTLNQQCTMRTHFSVPAKAGIYDLIMIRVWLPLTHQTTPSHPRPLVNPQKNTLVKSTFNQGSVGHDEVPSTLGFTLEMFHNDQFNEEITSDQESFSIVEIFGPPNFIIFAWWDQPFSAVWKMQ